MSTKDELEAEIVQLCAEINRLRANHQLSQELVVQKLQIAHYEGYIERVREDDTARDPIIEDHRASSGPAPRPIRAVTPSKSSLVEREAHNLQTGARDRRFPDRD